MKIGDEVYVHGYVDEMRKDVVIIRNEGGYFATVTHEIRTNTQECVKAEQTEPQKIIGESFPSYITEDRTTQVLDGWQANPRTSTTAIEAEPQTEVLAQIHELYAEIEKLLRKSSAEIVGAIREQGERKKGTYRDSDEEDEWYCHYYICNECGTWWMGSTNYCPNCGAELKGENDENTDRQKI